MKRRIEVIGGELAVESSPAQGTRLSFTVALPEATNHEAAQRAAG
jgi:signal transduction histidine kinase